MSNVFTRIAVWLFRQLIIRGEFWEKITLRPKPEVRIDWGRTA